MIPFPASVFFIVSLLFSLFAAVDTHSANSRFRFTDKTKEAGLDSFHHRLGNPEKPWIIDAMGSGAAVGDYDNDGDDDLYFVNGRPRFDRPDPAFRNALFRNNGGIFEDVTGQAGVGDMGHGMCAVFGDIDNDGWLDLFVGNYGENVLYRNNRDGTFTQVSKECGVDDGQYAASAAFVDVDRDGDLDLFVGNYVQFDPQEHGSQRIRYHGQKVLMGPLAFDSQRDILYANDGTGKFTNVSGKARINVSLSRAMGSVFFDLENDGNPDLYVTNDSTVNHVLRNRGDSVFEDLSYLSGGGFSDDGRGSASMGVSTGDFNNDGLLDLLITSYEWEPDTLYRNDGEGLLTDVSITWGLFGLTLKRVTWGNGFCDFDADGFLDIYTANGHVYPQVEAMNKGLTYPQGVSIYQNTGARFQPVSPAALPPDIGNHAGRGSALLDYDSDGDMDIVVNCIDSPPLLLENQSERGNWLQVRLDGVSAETFGVRVVARSGETLWTRMVDGGSGYLSQNSSLLHFGFGDIDRVDDLTIYWRNREPQVISSPEINRRLNVTN